MLQGGGEVVEVDVQRKKMAAEVKRYLNLKSNGDFKRGISGLSQCDLHRNLSEEGGRKGDSVKEL